ncbi:MAG: hypothetical protein ACRD45_02635 [Bryobacteraceae bacterium]
MPTLIAVGLSVFDHVLRFLSIALETAAIVRIVQQRLFTTPLISLACMLGVVLARDIVVSVPNYDTRAYTVAWEWTLFPLLAAQVWAGLDNLRAVARLYPRVGGFAVRLYLSCLAISVAACSLTLPFELRDIGGGATFLRSLFLLQRCIDSWIAGTLLLVSVYLVRFPAPSRKPPRNLVLNTVLLTIYFGGYAVLFMLENLTALGGAAIAEQAQFFLVILVYAAWAAGLSKKGERSEPWPRIDVVLVRGVGAGGK